MAQGERRREPHHREDPTRKSSCNDVLLKPLGSCVRPEVVLVEGSGVFGLFQVTASSFPCSRDSLLAHHFRH